MRGRINSPHAGDVAYHLHPFTNLAEHATSGDMFDSVAHALDDALVHVSAP